MFIFGGIFELTKELNDLCIFDMTANKFVQALEDPFLEDEPEKATGMAGAETSPMEAEASSPVKRGNTYV